MKKLNSKEKEAYIVARYPELAKKLGLEMSGEEAAAIYIDKCIEGLDADEVGSSRF